MLTPTADGQWLYKRDHRVRLPVSEIGVVADGVHYLRPALVLLYKARLRRPKDEADFASMRLSLPAADATWLEQALALVDPQHPWRESLRDP